MTPFERLVIRARQLRREGLPVRRPTTLVLPAAGGLLLVAAIVATAPLGGAQGARGGAGPMYGTRLAVEGLRDRDAAGYVPLALRAGESASPEPSQSLAPVAAVTGPAVEAAPPVAGYTVVAGDTLTGIATRVGISTTTLYWANAAQLPDPAALHVGQELVVPAVNGILVVVQSSDTLATLAARYGVPAAAIADANGLGAAGVVIGQTIVVPGVNPGPMPTPAPAAAKPATTRTTSGSGSTAPAVRLYWPLPGGRISQRYSSYHPAIDIAAPYGSRVNAAAAGTVVFAGWRSYSGGGNVIWIRHGNGLFTTYNHLSAWYVHVGQSVARGQRIGAVGTSGIATGPHLHFEVWVTYPWVNGSRAGIRNPCSYLRC